MATKRKVRAGREQIAAVRSFAVPAPLRLSVAGPSGLGIGNVKHRIDRVLLGPYIDPRVLLRLRDDQACLADSLGRLSGGSAASVCFQTTDHSVAGCFAFSKRGVPVAMTRRSGAVSNAQD